MKLIINWYYLKSTKSIQCGSISLRVVFVDYQTVLSMFILLVVYNKHQSYLFNVSDMPWEQFISLIPIIFSLLDFTPRIFLPLFSWRWNLLYFNNIINHIKSHLSTIYRMNSRYKVILNVLFFINLYRLLFITIVCVLSVDKPIIPLLSSSSAVL